MTPKPRASTGSADRKAVLFCPTCEYEAPLDGDWSREDRECVDGGRTAVSCPECGAVVVSQPRFAALDGGSTAGVVRPALELLNAVVRHDVL